MSSPKEFDEYPTPRQRHGSLSELGPPTPLPVRYRLYKKRYCGLFALTVLAVITAMPACWFGPIAPEAATEFDISVSQINWLGNIVSLIFIPVSLIIPVFCSRFGISRCAQLGTLMMLLSGWVRYVGTIASLDPRFVYAFLILGQTFAAIAQPIFQVLGPMYSEKWFDLRGRTTATMIIAMGNTVGNALGQLVSPLVGTARQSVLVLAIISTAAIPAVLFINDAPPTPPTFAGSKPSRSLTSLCRAILGLSVSPEAHMTLRERLDFVILTTVFGINSGAMTALSVLSAEWFAPMGYSNAVVGAMGASLFLSGVLAAIVAAPLLDRVFTHKFSVALKASICIAACSWFSLIWAVRPNNTAALFVILIAIGVSLMTTLPISLELGVELTRNADGSAALLWCWAYLCGSILVLAEGALRAPSTANPPYNMHSALILHGTTVMAISLSIFLIRARQARREMDEVMALRSATNFSPTPDTGSSKMAN